MDNTWEPISDPVGQEVRDSVAKLIWDSVGPSVLSSIWDSAGAPIQHSVWWLVKEAANE